MMNPTMLQMVVAVHQQNLLEEAKKSGVPARSGPRRSGGPMSKSGRHAGPSLRERLFARAGDMLISAGQRLQARYQPATWPCHETCH